MTDEEPTFSLEELGEVKTVRVYSQAYVAKQQKRIAELESQIEKMKCCANCDFIFRDGNCYYDKECKNKDHWKLRR